MATKKTPAQWAEIIKKVRSTGKMANTLAKALAKRYSYRWQFVDFRGPNGQESAGVVDIVAIRKSGKKPTIEGLKSLDLFDIILIQVKGGSAGKPTDEDLKRLKIVQDQYSAQAIVLFEWGKKKGLTRFSKLDDRDAWLEKTSAELFGKPEKLEKGGAKSLLVTDLWTGNEPGLSRAPPDVFCTNDAANGTAKRGKTAPKESVVKKLKESSNPILSVMQPSSKFNAATRAWATRKAAMAAASK